MTANNCPVPITFNYAHSFPMIVTESVLVSPGKSILYNLAILLAYLKPV